MINIDGKTRRLSQSTIVIGYKQENKAESIEFKIPDYLKEYGKKICFKTKDGKVFSKLFDNTTSNIFTFTRTETQYGELNATIEFFKTENEDMIIYKTSMLHIIFNETINCEDKVQPDEPKIPILESLIETVTDLNNTITENEETRNNNENTRISNENSRIANETQRDIYYTGIQNKVNNGEFNGATYLPNVDAEGNITWTNNKGLENPTSQNIRGPQGIQGPQGEAFKIKKTYPSIEAMQNDFDNMEVGDYAMIVTSIELEDNAKLYSRTETEWVFITDFSGATGIQGEQGPQGIQGIQGERGIGISKLEVIDGSLWVTLTDSTTQNAGLIITDEVKQWLVNEITNNAESAFNQYYNTKVSEFNENVQAKLDEYNANAEALANKVVELEAENTSLKNQIPSGEATGNPIHLTDSSNMECEIVPIGESKEKLYLPEEYTQLEYIESSGTQYIDTGFKPNQNSGVETLVETYDTNVLYNNPFGVRNENREQFFVGIQTDTQGNNNVGTWFLRYGTQNYISKFGIKYGQNHIIVNKNIYTINGDSYTFNSTIFQSSNNMYLFACNDNGKTHDRKMRGKMYYFKLYDNDVLIRNMIPCIRKSDNVVGMYDTVNNLFYENSGTGNFIAGPELTKSPDYPSEIVTVGQNGSVEIEVCNKNLFDKNTVLYGYLNPKTGNVDYATDIYTSDYIKINPSNKYYLPTRGSIRGKYFNKNKKLLYPSLTENSNYDDFGILSTGEAILTNIPSEAVYIRFSLKPNFLDTCYLVTGEKPTNYIPHQSYTKVLPLQKEFVKIGDVEDTFVKVDGKWYEKHCISKEIFNGEETWHRDALQGDNKYYSFYTVLTPEALGDSKCLCNLLPYNNGIYSTDRLGIFINWQGNARLKLKIDTITTVDELKEYLTANNITVYYILATPELIPCTAEQSAILNSFYTYKNVTNISMSGIGTLKVNYKKDLETMFNNIIKQIPSSTSDTTET